MVGVFVYFADGGVEQVHQAVGQAHEEGEDEDDGGEEEHFCGADYGAENEAVGSLWWRGSGGGAGAWVGGFVAAGGGFSG